MPSGEIRNGIRTPAGLFVSFEGGEGVGKSTQIEKLRHRFGGLGHSVTVTREPGGSCKAEDIRRILLSGYAKRFGPLAETALFTAARSDHVEQLIAPALARRGVVLCDRFTDSTRVYQGVAAGLPAALIERLERIATRGLRPDLTLILDLPAETGLARADARRGASHARADRFEGEGLAYHRRVRQAFLDIADREPDRCAVIDATPSAEAVADEIWSVVTLRLSLGEPAHVG